MADHIRNQIRDRAVVAVTSLSTTGANVYQTPLLTPEEQTLPALVVYIDSEVSSEDATMGNILRECVLHIDGSDDNRNTTIGDCLNVLLCPVSDIIHSTRRGDLERKK